MSRSCRQISGPDILSNAVTKSHPQDISEPGGRHDALGLCRYVSLPVHSRKSRTSICASNLLVPAAAQPRGWRHGSSSLANLSGPFHKYSGIRPARHPSSTPTRLPRWDPGPGCVARRENIPDIFASRALPGGRLAAPRCVTVFMKWTTKSASRGRPFDAQSS
jgi:hypothetical protein